MAIPKLKMTDPLLDIIPGDIAQRAKNLNRRTDIQDNINAVRAEFIGKPEVCHALAAEIIHLRRDPDNTEHRDRFRQLLFDYKYELLDNLDVRWLLSICDTIVDIGNPVESAIAMNIVQVVNQTNIHATLLINVVDGRLDTNKLSQELKVPTWGGMITADVPSGDMIYNMMNRLNSVVERDLMLNSIWLRIKQLGESDPNVVLNHVCNCSRFAKQRKYFV